MSKPNKEIPPNGAHPNDAHPNDWAEVMKKRKANRGWWYARREPKAISDVIAKLVQRKGYAAIQSACQFSEAWNDAIGERLAKATSPGQLKRGVLEVIVANSLLMQELGFDKERLLKQMQTALPEAGIKQLRFKVGKV